MENERLTRENVGLQGDLHKVQLSVLENASELNKHRENVQLGEREKYTLRSQLESYQQEGQRLAEEVESLKQLLQQERQARQTEHSHLNGRLSAARNEMSAYQQQVQLQQNQIQTLQRDNVASPLPDRAAAFAQQQMTQPVAPAEDPGSHLMVSRWLNHGGGSERQSSNGGIAGA